MAAFTRTFRSTWGPLYYILGLYKYQTPSRSPRSRLAPTPSARPTATPRKSRTSYNDGKAALPGRGNVTATGSSMILWLDAWDNNNDQGRPRPFITTASRSRKVSDPAPQQLAFSAVPAYGYVAAPFSVTVQALDTNGLPQCVTSDTTIVLVPMRRRIPGHWAPTTTRSCTAAPAASRLPG